MFARSAVSDFIGNRSDDILGPDEDMAATARAIGIPVPNGTFVFENETEMAFLFDYQIMIEERDGKTPMSRYLETLPREGLGIKEETAVSCLSSFRYTVFYTEELVPGLGLLCFDLLSRERFFLTDHNFPKSMEPAASAMVASGIMCHGDAWMTSGAAIPYPLSKDGMLAELEEMVAKDFIKPLKWKKRPPMTPTPSQQAQLARNLIRLAIKSGATDNIQMA